MNADNYFTAFGFEPTFDIKLFSVASFAGGAIGGAEVIGGEQAVETLEGALDINGGFSLGVFVDSSSKEVVSTVMRLEWPSLSVFGIPLSPGAGVHFQWYKGKEQNRRLESLLKFDGVPKCPVRTSICDERGGWKDFKRIVNEEDVYAEFSSVQICETRLLDLDPYNRIITVTSDPDEFDFPERVSPRERSPILSKSSDSLLTIPLLFSQCHFFSFFMKID